MGIRGGFRPADVNGLAMSDELKDLTSQELDQWEEEIEVSHGHRRHLVSSWDLFVPGTDKEIVGMSTGDILRLIQAARKTLDDD